ncbi:MAG TPA: TIR-like protein FxsC [Streptosporangiaceae bacterium]|nr:TIR-like protein FxsC [Streptosporangiaceae bacterium]
MSSEPASTVLGESAQAHECSYSTERNWRENLFDLRLVPAIIMAEPPGTVPTLPAPYYYWHSARLRGGTPGVFDEVQRRTPVFFLSYAHPGRSRRNSPREATRRVRTFFQDLQENVGQLVARPAGADPGYMDTSVPTGGRWTDELLNALGTCQVFVALLSAPYLSSPWCGREWHAFAQRTVVPLSAANSEHPTGIFPVLWAPVRSSQVPPQIREVQRFSPADLPETDICEQYEANGVFGLKKIRDSLAYDAVVWRLAQNIEEFLSSNRVEPKTLGKDELRDIFREKVS